MSDVMDKDEKCKGCYYYVRSYTVAPCNECSVAFSGMQKNYYNNDHLSELVAQTQTLGGYDMVKQPKHYMICDMEALDIIKMTLSEEEFKGYILGNVLKYRLRAGKKGGSEKTQEDIQKALQYEEMFERYFD